MMRLSVSNIAWSAENDGEMLAFLRDNGFSGLEIAPTRIFPEAPYEKKEDAKAFAEQLRMEFGLKVCSMQSIWYGKTQNIFGSHEEKNELLNYTNKASDFAEAISCNNLVFGCPKNRNRPEGEIEESVIDFFRIIADYAHEHNTAIALEPNPVIYGTNFINTTQDAFAFVKKVASPGFKVNIDMGTILYNKESFAQIENNFEYVNHVHISEPGLERIAITNLHRELAVLLRRCQYKGYVSLEMKNLGDLQEVKTAALEMKEVFGE